jgi:hypothetical protein
LSSIPRSQLLNCRTVVPFGAQTQVKLNGSYPLPGGFMVGGIFQNISGPQITASYAARSAAIELSLGRNLAASGTRPPCTATAGSSPPPLSTRASSNRARSLPSDAILARVAGVVPDARATARWLSSAPSVA